MVAMKRGLMAFAAFAAMSAIPMLLWFFPTDQAEFFRHQAEDIGCSQSACQLSLEMTEIGTKIVHVKNSVKEPLEISFSLSSRVRNVVRRRGVRGQVYVGTAVSQDNALVQLVTDAERLECDLSECFFTIEGARLVITKR